MFGDESFNSTDVGRFDIAVTMLIGHLCGAETIPACRAPGWSFMRPESSYPDGNARRLYWFRQKCYLVHPIMLSLVTERLAAHQSRKNIQPFIEHSSPLLVVSYFTKAGETFILRISQAKTQNEATVREMI